MKDKELSKLLGGRVRIARLVKSLSQKALAEELGFSSQYLSKLETGKKLISTDTLIALCAILQMPLSYFDPYKPGPEEKIYEESQR
jgi:transcriptional regulator with XRE-family HTH domain